MISGRNAALAVLAIAAVALAAYWLVHNTEWVDSSTPVPLKGEAARNPLYAVSKLASALGARVTQPQSFARVPPEGAVLVLISDYWDLFPERRAELRAWVERGGRLVVGANRIGDDDDLAQWLGVTTRFHADAQRADDKARKDNPRKDNPKKAEADEDTTKDDSGSGRSSRAGASPQQRARCDPLRESGRPALPGHTVYRVCGFNRYRTLVLTGDALWQLDGRLGPQVARLPAGRGSVTLLQSDLILRQREPLQADHARLFVAATGLHADDELWLVAFESADSVFVLAWRHGAPVLLLLALAIVLALWRGLRRFGPTAAASAAGRRSLAEQIRGTGDFLLRHKRGPVLRAALVRALEAAAASRIAGWAQMPPGARVAAIARLADMPVAPLERAMAVGADVPRHELEQALALMETARRALLRWRVPKAAAPAAAPAQT
jgi:hypothetical protein